MTNITRIELFVAESNRIEGIHRLPLEHEIEAHLHLLRAGTRTGLPLLSTLGHFVATVQPGAVLRDRAGLDVRVGNHYPPRSGPEIADALTKLLIEATAPDSNPYTIHQAYQNLHPFTDGNGRSGRALWLRMMGGPERLPLGFLHTWYYQSLSDGDRTS